MRQSLPRGAAWRRRGLFGLPTLAMGLALEATAHGKAGRHAEMHRAAGEARAVGTDDASVEAALWGNAEASYHLHRDDLASAHDALARSIAYLRRSGAAGAPFAGVWSLLSTLLDLDGEAARAEIRAMPLDTPMSRAMVIAADAVVAAATVIAPEQQTPSRSRTTSGSISTWLSPVNDALAGGACRRRGRGGEPEAWLARRSPVSTTWASPASFGRVEAACKRRLHRAQARSRRRSRAAELAALGITTASSTCSVWSARAVRTDRSPNVCTCRRAPSRNT